MYFLPKQATALVLPLLAASVLFFGTAESPAAPLTMTSIEKLTGVGGSVNIGEITFSDFISIDSVESGDIPGSNMVGYAVDFLDATSLTSFAVSFVDLGGGPSPLFSNVPGWSGEVVSELDWATTEIVPGTTGAVLGAFDELFGTEDNAAAVFQLSGHFDPLQNGINDQDESTWSSFTFLNQVNFGRGGDASSNFITLGSGGTVLDASLASAIPEPSRALLFVLGGIATLATRRRR